MNISIENIFDGEFKNNSEIIKELYNDNNTKIEIIYSNNASTDYMVSDLDEYVFLIEGCATLEFKENDIFLERGNYFLIPKNTTHRVKNTSDNAIWLTIYLGEKKCKEIN